MVELSLSTYLKSRPAVAAIVGTRVYAERAPQTTVKNKVLPHIVYRLLPGSRRYYHSTGPSGLVEAAVQLTMTCQTYDAARDLYEAVRNEIDGYSGNLSTTVVDSVMLGPPAGASGDPVQGDDTGFPSVGAVAAIFYREAAPVPVNP